MTYSVKQFFDDMALELRERPKMTPPLSLDLQDIYVVICNKYRGYIESDGSYRDSTIQKALNRIRGIEESSEDVVGLPRSPKHSFWCCCCCGFFSRSHHNQEEVPILKARPELSPELKILEQCFIALQKNDLAKVEEHFNKIRTVQKVPQTRKLGKRRSGKPVISDAEGSMSKVQSEKKRLLKPQGPAPVPSKEQKLARSKRESGLTMPQRSPPVPVINS